MATPVDRGPGSITPTFTAPSVGVATPGINLQTPPSDFERFRDAILAAGQGVASAVSARAAIDSRLKSLKEQSVAKVERDLNRAARGLQEQRLETAIMRRHEILVEAETRGLEWAERRFRTAMLNAPSAQEAKVWEAGWQQANAMITRNNGEARRQQFNSAARTMELTAMSLKQAIAEDPNLEAALIGDGVGIGARVQNWMLKEISDAIDLDKLTEDDANVLIHQALKQSFSIADDLIATYTKRVDKSNEILGAQQIDSDLYATFTGEQDVNRLGPQLSATLRDRMSHLTVEQQHAYLKQRVVPQLLALSSGEYGLDTMAQMEKARGVLAMEYDGVPLFTAAERAALGAEMQRKAIATVGKVMDAEISRLREAQSEVLALPDGRMVRVPNANPDALLLRPDPYTGVSLIDEAANRVLTNMGLTGDRMDNLSPEEALLVAEVRAAALSLKDESARRANKVYSDVANARTVFGGEPGGNANKAQEFSPERRAYQSPDALYTSGYNPLSGDELVAFKRQLSEVAGILGVDRSVIEAWDGRPLDYTDENREINLVIAANEARKWSSPQVQAQYGMPSTLVEDKMALLRSGDPNRLEAFAQFVLFLDKGANGAWDNFVGAPGVTANEAAAAQWLRISARLGTAGPGATAPDYTAMAAQVQAIVSAPPITEWLRASRVEGDTVSTNAGVMAQVLTDIIASRTDAEFIDPDEDDPYNSRLRSQLQAMFLGETGSVGRQIESLWFSGKIANPDLDDAQVGALIWSWLIKDGQRPRSVNGRIHFVQDPQGYTGEDGGDINEHVTRHMTREFTPEYRAFLGEALGVAPKDIPVNMQHLFLGSKIGTDPSAPFTPGAVVPRWSFNEAVNDRLLDSRANYGGFAIGAQTSTGQVLPVPVSKFDATLTWPDGSSVFVPKGTVLSVINPDLFVPSHKSSGPAVSQIAPSMRQTTPTVNLPQM